MKTLAGMTHQARAGHLLRLPVHLNIFFKVSSSWKRKVKCLQLENRQYYAYESSGIETFQKWLYATGDSQYMGNFQHRHFCLHLEMWSYSHENILSMTNHSADYHWRHFWFFFPLRPLSFSQEPKTSHFFQVWITSTQHALSNQKPSAQPPLVWGNS